MVDRALLSNVELFRGIDDADLDRLVDTAEPRSFSRGDIVFTEGDDPSELFVVLDGRIAIANKSIDGRESVMALMEAGDLFGEMPLFDGLTRSAEARALEPSRPQARRIRSRATSATWPMPIAS